MQALYAPEFGSLDKLEVRELPDSPLPPGTVRIAVEAAGVNPSDVGVAMGRFPTATAPRVLGRDFAGRVVEGPPELVGAEVWGSGGGELGMTRDGAHADTLIFPADAVVRRPAGLSAEAGAVAGVPYTTAWSALVDLAGFSGGEWVLVSAAAGAVGSAAVQLAVAMGGHAIALVREADDLSALEGIPVAGTITFDLEEVPPAVRRLTGDRGVDVALNGVGAPVFGPMMESLAKEGRMTVYSAVGGREATFDLFAFYRGRFSFFGLDTAHLSLHQIARILERLAPFFEAGHVKPPPIVARFPLSRAREAYERVQRGEQGKVVIVPDPLYARS